jgi:hypothetical protein
MTAKETVTSEGFVNPYFIDVRTGRKMPWSGRHNTISFDATKAMALSFGGDPSLIPNRIGIIYGPPDSEQEFDQISRDQVWSDIIYEMNENTSDIQVQSFSYSPSFAKVKRDSGWEPNASSSFSSTDSGEDSGEEYPGWAVTFHAHSDSVTPGIISVGSSGEGSGSRMIFTTGAKIFQALLLNENRGDYTVIARVSLKSGPTYYSKPENFELALDWTIKFF